MRKKLEYPPGLLECSDESIQVCLRLYYAGKQQVHARIQKILLEGSNFDNVFFKLMRGGRIQMPL